MGLSLLLIIRLGAEAPPQAVAQLRALREPASEEELRIMTVAWSPDELERIGTAEELQIAASRADETPRRAVPIWVVSVGGQVYVRTWYRRDSGWFGHAVTSRRARIRVPGLEAGIAIEDVGDDQAELRASVDAAYRAKYGRYGETTVDRMVSDDAAASTLRLIPERLPARVAGKRERLSGHRSDTLAACSSSRAARM
jgi:hypothetical protein